MGSKSSSKQSLGSSLYSGAAAYGRFSTSLGFIISAVISIICVAIGIYLVIKKNIYTIKTTGTVVSCVQTYNGEPQWKYHCNVKYTVGKDVHYIYYDTRGDTSVQHDKVDVYYEKNKPAIARVGKPQYHLFGEILIGMGVLIILMSYLSYWIAHRYKFFAAGVAVDSFI